MNGIDAKRVFLALAKKWHFSSVRRCNESKEYYKLKFVNSSGRSVNCLGEQRDNKYHWLNTCLFTSTNWFKMLQSLEGKTIGCGSERVKVISIEQLIIDLEIGGWLKNI